MSSSTAADAEYAAEYQQVLISSWTATSAIALYAFEYLITIRQEVDLVWKRKWSGVTVLFALNRYVALVYSLSNIATIPGYEGYVFVQWAINEVSLSLSIFSCLITTRLLHTLALLQFLITAVFSALRVYALTGRAMFITLITFALSLLPLAANLYNDATYILVYILSQDVCTSTFSGSPDLVTRLALATRISTIVSDVLVLLVTWYKTGRDYQEARKAGVDAPLVKLLLRDGTLYFAALLGLNLYQILTNTVPVLAIVDPGTSYIVTLTPILISRFLLNLRQIDKTGEKASDGAPVSHVSSLAFRVVGNMGETLHSEVDVVAEEFRSENFELETSIARRSIPDMEEGS